MYLESNPRDRIRAAAPALVVHALLALLILRGLGVAPGLAPPEILKLVNVTPPPPPVPEVHVRAPDRASRREGAAAPPALEARPTEIVAPPPVLPPPPAIPAAPVAGPGSAPASGATPLPGPGTGAGGIGNGTGSGRFGNGPGNGLDGDGDGRGGGFSPPRRIRGRITDRDYPAAVGEAGTGGTVSVIYTIEPDGRATECRITRSSGNRALDATTCRLIEERFRFDPSRDRQGRPVRSRMVQDHYWEVEDLPPDPQEPPRRRRGFRLF
jgi:protein TonB